MPRNIPFLSALIGFLLLLGACDDPGPRTVNIYTSTQGSLITLQNTTRTGNPVPVYAIGALFESDFELARRIAADLDARDPYIRFAASAGDPTLDTGSVRVLVIHETPSGFTGISACQGKRYQAEPQEDEILFRVIVCKGTDRLIEVQAHLPRDRQNLEDDYNKLLKQAMPTVFSKEDRSPK